MGLWISSKQERNTLPEKFSFPETAVTSAPSESIFTDIISYVLTIIAALLIAGSVVMFSFNDMQTAARNVWVETDAEVYNLKYSGDTVSAAYCHYFVEDNEYNAVISKPPEHTRINGNLNIYYHKKNPSQYCTELPADNSFSLISGTVISFLFGLVCAYLSYRVKRGGRSNIKALKSQNNNFSSDTTQSRTFKMYDGSKSDNYDNY